MAMPPPSSDTTCVVTGASSGIGTEIARELARRGFNLTLVGRRENRLVELADELREDFDVIATPIACDVRDSEQRTELIKEAQRGSRSIAALVNNAGLGAAGRFASVDEERALAMIDTNIRALVSLSRLALPAMIENESGAIMNVASTAGFQPIPTEAVYSASKAFVVNFSDALGRELLGSGVSCTALCPGPTATEFASVAGIENGFDSLPRFVVADAAEVAQAGVDAMIRGKRICVPGALNKLGAFAGSKAPRPVVLKTLDTFWPAADH